MNFRKDQNFGTDRILLWDANFAYSRNIHKHCLVIGCNPNKDVHLNDNLSGDSNTESFLQQLYEHELCTDGILHCKEYLADTMENIERISNCVETAGDLTIRLSAIEEAISLGALNSLERVNGELRTIHLLQQ